MARTPKVTSPRIKEAAEVLLENPRLKTSFALRGAGYTREEAASDTVQARLRRYKATLVPVPVITTTELDSVLSPITTATPINAEADTTTVSSQSPASDGTKRGKKRKKKPDGFKEIRNTPSQVMTKRNNDKIVIAAEKKALKKATIMFSFEKKKPRSDPTKKSARTICEMMNASFGTNLNERRVEIMVAQGKIGWSPTRRGPKGSIPDATYKVLVTAFTTYVLINQVNGQGRQNERKRLIPKVNSVPAMPDEEISESECLFRRLRQDSDVTLDAKPEEAVEDRRRRWTSFTNLTTWFDVWEAALLQYGFATVENDIITIMPDQLGKILNLDESKLSLDGSSTQAGGRPASALYCPDLPSLGKCATKSSLACTIICGSTAAGEALPPHFQLPSRAQTDEAMKVRSDVFRHMVQVQGQFGHKGAEKFDCTLGLNEKGGMDSTEFEKYLVSLVFRLYPTTADKDGARVIVKVDSGPGRTNTQFVHQETDQTYGLFKTRYTQNLEKFAADREKENLSTAPNVSHYGLFVFGGTDHESGCVYQNAFEDAFAKERCLKSWAAVGAAPCTRACLRDKKVQHRLTSGEDGSDEDPLAAYLRNLQFQNTLCVEGLNCSGYNGEALRATLIKEKKKARLTHQYPQSKIELLANCSTAGDRFTVTGGEHLTADDAFKAIELGNRKKEAEAMQKDKKKRQAQEKKEAEALAILETEKPVSQLKVGELTKLLQWHEVPTKEMGSNVSMKRDKWISIKNSGKAAPVYAKWTDEDEQKLKDMESGSTITIEETQLGRLKAERNSEFEAVVRGYSEVEYGEFVQRVRAEWV